jgi:hypothetical protein
MYNFLRRDYYDGSVNRDVQESETADLLLDPYFSPFSLFGELLDQSLLYTHAKCKTGKTGAMLSTLTPSYLPQAPG